MPLVSTILVVDDDPEVLAVAVIACEEMGLTVLSAEDGAGALLILRDNPKIELLLTDIAMPNIDRLGVGACGEAAISRSQGHLHERLYKIVSHRTTRHGLWAAVAQTLAR